MKKLNLQILAATGAILMGVDAFILQGLFPHLIGLALVLTGIGFLFARSHIHSPIQRSLLFRSFMILWFLLLLLLVLSQTEQSFTKTLLLLVFIPGLGLLVLSMLVWWRFKEFERISGLMDHLKKH